MISLFFALIPPPPPLYLSHAHHLTPIARGDDSDATAEAIAACAGIAPDSTACKVEELTATIRPGLHHTTMKWLFLATHTHATVKAKHPAALYQSVYLCFALLQTIFVCAFVLFASCSNSNSWTRREQRR